MDIYYSLVNLPQGIVGTLLFNVSINGVNMSQSYAAGRAEPQGALFGIPSSGTLSIWNASDSNWTQFTGGSHAYSGLIDGQIYNLDFQTGILTLVTAPSPTVAPVSNLTRILVALLPWDPLSGPPLPEGFFPPWPMSISNWLAIPGYPKLLPKGG